MARNSQVTRILRLLQWIESAGSRGITASELHDRAREALSESVTKRTIYRDIDAISEVFPLTETDGRFSFTSAPSLGKDFRLHPRDIFSFYLARQALQPLEGSALHDFIFTIFDRLEDTLGKNEFKYLGELKNEFKFDPNIRWATGSSADVLQTIHMACAEGQQLAFRYQGIRDIAPRDRRVGPHFIYVTQGSFYLVATDMDNNEYRTFAIPRMSDTEMSEAPFDAQQVSPLRLRIGLTPDFVSWVLGFGSNVQVHEPERLQNMVIEAAETILRSYGKS
jgi:predicted DNA-binding transcriptional regulator YafY